MEHVHPVKVTLIALALTIYVCLSQSLWTVGLGGAAIEEEHDHEMKMDIATEELTDTTQMIAGCEVTVLNVPPTVVFDLLEAGPSLQITVYDSNTVLDLERVVTDFRYPDGSMRHLLLEIEEGRVELEGELPATLKIGNDLVLLFPLEMEGNYQVFCEVFDGDVWCEAQNSFSHS